MHLKMSVIVGVLAAGILGSPAMAAEPSTRLVRCGEQSCLRVTGHRDDPASIVRINSREVPVEGERSWRVNLPLAVVREWSAPNSRTIEVSLADPEGDPEIVASVDLPIGLLANTTTLAALVITVH